MPHNRFLSPDRSLASAVRLYLNPSPGMMDIGSDQAQPPSLFDGALIGNSADNILYSEMKEMLQRLFHAVRTIAMVALPLKGSVCELTGFFHPCE